MKHISFLSLCILLQTFLFGQLTITNGSTPAVLVDSLVNNNGVTFSNVTFNGVYGTSSNYQAGLFSAAGSVATDLGFTSGVVLCTGKTNDIPLSMGTYPGNSNFSSSGFTSCTSGEVRESGTCSSNINDVNVLAGSERYYNSAILEFDFVPNASVVEFEYVFGSEEYDQDDGSFSVNYNCSSYNDKFGFIISGPGISGGQGYTNNGKNIARLANGSEVSINSVNNGIVGSYGGSPSAANCTAANPLWSSGSSTAEFNGAIYGIQFNGNTKVLTASQSGLTAGATYHIKLIVTDVKDGAYDSGVFLNAASFGPPVALPVQLTDFKVACKDQTNELAWQTSSEINNAYFDVEKSMDGVSFSTIGSVNGSGNSTNINNYSFTDFEQGNDLVYYRLKQVDFNGQFEYSNLIALEKCEESVYEINKVYFSASNGIIIDYKVNQSEKIQVSLYDVQGKVVQQNQLTIDKHENQQRVALKTALDNAVYVVRIVTNSKVDVKKIIVSK